MGPGAGGCSVVNVEITLVCYVAVAFTHALQFSYSCCATTSARRGGRGGCHGTPGAVNTAKVGGDGDWEEAAARVVRAVQRTGETWQVRRTYIL